MDAAKEAVAAAAEGVKNLAIGGSGGDKKKVEKKEKTKKPAPDVAAEGPLEMIPPPAFLQARLDVFDRLKNRYDEDVASKPREPITISMPDGSIKEGTSWETSPADIAKGISNSLLKRAVVARLDGDPEQLWDLTRPLERSCRLEILDFEDPQGKMVFWHSSAHILGEACERRFGCSLCIGPPVDNGFYYEMALPDGGAVQQTDWKPLETIVGGITKEKQKFERLIMTKDELLEMFSYNKYKQHIIKDKIKDGESTTVYRNGPLIDLCRGPHVPDTGRIESFAIMKNSASYFLGSAENDSLQRIYGISFPDKKMMAAHKKFLEEAAKRDHRNIARDQELFFFHEWSPGSAFWLPHGSRVNKAIINYLQEQYWERGYEEVITPNMYNSALWKQSGHYAHYKDDMFVLNVDKEEFGLKPMNCPAHALMFSHRVRNYRELPWRVADFGVLHRNEASGALSGLTRVRRFQQDDAHIFCAEDQIKSEMLDLFDFMRSMYGLLDLTFKMRLSTRPEKFMGDIEVWDRAEDRLKEALDDFAKSAGGVPWELNPGDGAFYGPKIDIAILDCLNREWQCATIQLDFQQPNNFNLHYMTGEEGRLARPVMIHRAMAGSIERFTGILCEHFAGKWPFWLSPRQVLVIPVGKGFLDYAEEVRRIFHRERLHVDVDSSGNTLQKKIRTGQLAQYNFICVVGAEEQDGRMVNVRSRDDPESQNRGVPVSLDEAVAKLRALKDSRGRESPFSGR